MLRFGDDRVTVDCRSILVDNGLHMAKKSQKNVRMPEWLKTEVEGIQAEERIKPSVASTSAFILYALIPRSIRATLKQIAATIEEQRDKDEQRLRDELTQWCLNLKSQRAQAEGEAGVADSARFDDAARKRSRGDIRRSAMKGAG